MDHHILLIDPMHKKSITAEVANRAGRTLVFVRTKLGADRVAEQLREQGVFAAALHGGLNQGARNRVLVPSRTAACLFWSPRTWPPAESTWTTSASYCKPTHRRITRTTSTAQAVRLAQVRKAL